MQNDIEQSLHDIVREAGRLILSFYRGAFEVGEKSPDNPVTEADLAADSLLKARLRALLPEAGWLSEESADRPERLERAQVWVVDPLDGTKEFVLGIPEFSVSVALVADGKPVLAAVYHPVSENLFSARLEQGTRLNGRPVAVSDLATLAGARIDASRSERKRGEFAPFEELVELRTVGSIAYKLARVAAGLADATWSRGPKHEWDICAGSLLVTEAGGEAVDLDDRPFTFNKPFPKVNGIIADNHRLHAAIRTALAPHRHTARTD